MSGEHPAAARPARVVVVDDDGGLRELLRLALGVDERFEVVGEAGDLATALGVLDEQAPELVVLDLGLPDLNGIDVIGRMRGHAPEARIVVFTGAEPADTERAALEAGASRFVVKGGDLQRLVEALAGVAASAPLSAWLRLEASPGAVKQARDFIAETCGRLDCPDVEDDASLIASELVANAVVHAHSESEVRVRRTNSAVRIEVTDYGPGMPEPQVPELLARNGRGLLIVSALSEAWGIDPQQGSKTVWAELSFPGG